MRRHGTGIGWIAALALAGVLPVPALGAVLRVGPGQEFARPSLAASTAHDGDVVEIAAGSYPGDVAVWRADRLTLRGIGGRPVLDAHGALAQGKAIWVIQGRDTTVEDIVFTGAASPDRNGAGIRQEGPGLTVRHCVFHDNNDGILAGDSPDSTITVADSEFVHNGQGDGYSHNLYINHVRRFMLRGCWVHDAHVGHDVKSRARENDILYNRIGDDVESDTSYLIDFPEGGDCRVIGNVLRRGPKALQNPMLGFAEEGAKNPMQALFVINNTIINDKGATPPLLLIGTPTLVTTNNLLLMRGTAPSDAPMMTTGGDPVASGHNRLAAPAEFVDSASGDYHLAAGSPAIDAGNAPGSDDGMELTPHFEYAAPLGVSARPAQGPLDIGAFERIPSGP